MERSRYLAGLIGPVMLAFGAALLINRQILPQLVEAAQDTLFIMVAGMLTLLAGLAIVLGHRTWRGWPAIITALGWLAIIGGAARLILPGVVAQIAPLALGHDWILLFAAAVLLILGGFLSFQAFFKRVPVP